jgi:hypothetical protein
MYRIWIWWRSGLFCIAQSIVFLFQTCCRLQIWFDQIWTLCLESLVKSQCFQGFLSWIMIVSNSNSTNISGAVTLPLFCESLQVLSHSLHACKVLKSETVRNAVRMQVNLTIPTLGIGMILWREGISHPILIQNMMKGSLQKMEIYVGKCSLMYNYYGRRER